MWNLPNRNSHTQQEVEVVRCAKETDQCYSFLAESYSILFAFAIFVFYIFLVVPQTGFNYINIHHQQNKTL